MKTKLSTECMLAKIPAHPPKVPRKLARERAVDLAVRKGRSAQDVSKSDWEQAKRELKNEPKSSSISTAEREQWNPLPSSVGYKVHVPSGDDEDDEGRSDTERLVERGVRDAGRDQMREASLDDGD